ncbi:VWA domain-containing protein [Vibrio penaeicida]|nr:VWA domain-containing protein [Vibrio penaeicida]
MQRKILAVAISSVILTACGGGSGDTSDTNTTVSPPAPVEKISAEIQSKFGAIPGKIDTDGDSLPDDFEITLLYPFGKPDLSDTDGNGVSDANEDHDSDGLTNLIEFEHGTNPLDSDSDKDGLSDQYEIDQFGTDPLVADTDQDGLSDKEEYDLGLDPLTVSVLENLVTSTGIPGELKVSLTGDDYLAKHVKIFELGLPNNLQPPGLVGKPYEIHLDDEKVQSMDRAHVSFPYDDSVDPNNLGIFTFDEVKELWVPADNAERQIVIDETSKVVSLELEHFSKYGLFDKQAWESYYSNIPNVCEPSDSNKVRPLELAFVLDSSGSMRWSDPNDIRIVGSKHLVDRLKDIDRGAVIDFDRTAKLLQSLTDNKVAIKSALDSVGASGGTDIGNGVSKALEEFANARPASDWAVVLLTDGDGSYDHSLTAELAQKNIRVLGITMGSGANKSLIRDISDSTYGIYQHVNTADELIEVFERFSTISGDTLVDTDQDGLTDCQEIQGIRVANSTETFFTDPNNPDTDGDGLLDGIEVGERVSLTENTSLNPTQSAALLGSRKGYQTINNGTFEGSYHKMISNPTVADTDGDGVNDAIELDGEANPLIVDSDGDGVLDGVEGFFETSFVNVDTDLDVIEDSLEVAHQHYGLLSGVYSYILDLDPTNARLNQAGFTLSNEKIAKSLGYRTELISTSEFPFVDFNTYQNTIIIPNAEPSTWNIDQDYQDSLSSLLLQQGLLTRLEFTKGLIVGLEVEGDDFMAPNTTAALMGGLVSGFIVVGDVRDAFINVSQADFGEALLNLAALVPGKGDAINVAKVPVFVNSFVRRFPKKRAAVLSLIAKAPFLPEDYKRAALVAELGMVADVFLSSEEQNLATSGARSTAVSNDSSLTPSDLLKLVSGTKPRTLENLAQLVKNGKVSTKKIRSEASQFGAVNGYFGNATINGVKRARGRLGEFYTEYMALNHLYPNSRTFESMNLSKVYSTSVPSKKMPQGSVRHIDVAIETADNRTIGLESKVGQIRNSKFVRNQIEKDCEIINQPVNGQDILDEIEWHFYPSAVSNSIGFPAALTDMFDCPKFPGGKKIKPVIHLP